MKMTITSAQAAKLFRKLNEEQDALKTNERKSQVFSAGVDENPENARPVYDYTAMQNQLDELAVKVRRLKHALNEFNVKTEVPGFDMTIDEMLVYIPQLSEKKRKLTEMSSHLPKERKSAGYGSNSVIEYEYANYDITKVQADLEAVTDELSKAQLALDSVNNTVLLEIDL